MKALWLGRGGIRPLSTRSPGRIEDAVKRVVDNESLLSDEFWHNFEEEKRSERTKQELEELKKATAEKVILKGDYWTGKQEKHQPESQEKGLTKIIDPVNGNVRVANMRTMMSALLAGGVDHVKMDKVKKESLHVFLNDISAIRRAQNQSLTESDKNVERMLGLLPKKHPSMEEILDLFVKRPSVDEVKALISRLGVLGKRSDPLNSLLIYCLGRAGRVVEAEDVFSSRIISKNSDLFLAMADAYVFNDKKEKIRELMQFVASVDPGFMEDYIASRILAMLLLKEDLTEARKFMEEMEEGCWSPFVKTTILGLSVFSKAGDMDRCRILLRMTEAQEYEAMGQLKTTSLYDTYFRVLCFFGELEEAENLLASNRLTPKSAIKAEKLLEHAKRSSSKRHWEHFLDEELQRKRHGYIRERGVAQYNTEIRNAMKHQPSSKVMDAISGVYDRMRKALIAPNTETFELLMTALLERNRIEGVLKMFNNMSELNTEPSGEMTAKLLAAAIRYKKSEHCENEDEFSEVVETSLEWFMKRQDQLSVYDCCIVFEALEVHNDFAMVKKLVSMMHKNEIQPVKRIVVAVVNACIHQGNLLASREMFSPWMPATSEKDLIESSEGVDETVRLLAANQDLMGALQMCSLSALENSFPVLRRSTYEALVKCYEVNGGDLMSLPIRLANDSEVPTNPCSTLVTYNFLLAAHQKVLDEDPSRLSVALRAYAYQKDVFVDGVTQSYRFNDIKDLKLLARKYETWKTKRIPHLYDAFTSAMRVAVDRGLYQKAEQLFAAALELEEISADLYYEQIRCKLLQHQTEDAIGIMRQMKKLKLVPTAESYSSVIGMLPEGSLTKAETILTDGLMDGHSFSVEDYENTILHACSDLQASKDVFEKILDNGLVPSRKSFINLRKSFMRSCKGEMNSAQREMDDFLNELGEKFKFPGLRALSTVVTEANLDRGKAGKIFKGLAEPKFALALLERVGSDLPAQTFSRYKFDNLISVGDLDEAGKELKLIDDASSEDYDILIREYTKRKQADRVKYISREIEQRRLKKSINTYNGIMGCYLMSGKPDEVMRIAAEIVTSEDVNPNQITIRLCELAAKLQYNKPAHMDITIRLKYKLDESESESTSIAN